MAAEGPPTEKGRSWLRRQWDTLGHYGTRALWWLSNKTCQHGENPTRLLGVMLVLVLFFAGVHSVCGIVDNAAASVEGVQYIIAPGLEMGDPAHWPGQLVETLYFSVVTFTSLGYGDMRPATHAGKVLAMVEVSLGIGLITVFVGCVIRKLNR